MLNIGSGMTVTPPSPSTPLVAATSSKLSVSSMWRRVVYAEFHWQVYGNRAAMESGRLRKEMPVCPFISSSGAAKLLNEYEADSNRRDFGLGIVGIRIGVIAGHGRVEVRVCGLQSLPQIRLSVSRPNFPYDEEMRASLILCGLMWQSSSSGYSKPHLRNMGSIIPVEKMLASASWWLEFVN